MGRLSPRHTDEASSACRGKRSRSASGHTCSRSRRPSRGSGVANVKKGWAASLRLTRNRRDNTMLFPPAGRRPLSDFQTFGGCTPRTTKRSITAVDGRVWSRTVSTSRRTIACSPPMNLTICDLGFFFRPNSPIFSVIILPLDEAIAMDRLEAMQLFVATVETGSFSGASLKARNSVAHRQQEGL